MSAGALGRGRYDLAPLETRYKRCFIDHPAAAKPLKRYLYDIVQSMDTPCAQESFGALLAPKVQRNGGRSEHEPLAKVLPIHFARP